ncbi:MAG: PEP-CTERM sorting domain-containing protein [Planctomycetota bacterium]|jgi:hypothetical protein
MRAIRAIAMMLTLSLAADAQALCEVNYADGLDSYVECVSYRQLSADDDHPGAWEYVYDLYGGSYAMTLDISIRGFDASESLNLTEGIRWAGPISPTDQYLWQRWDAHSIVSYAAWGDIQWKDYSPSTWEDTGGGVYDWVNTAAQGAGYEYYNDWHTGDEYHVTEYSGEPMIAEGAVLDDGLDSEGIYFNSYSPVDDWTGLHATFRVVHADPPGEITFTTYRNNGYGSPDEVYGAITGPGGPLPPGDVNGDRQVDDGDIDILCDNLGDADYDLDGDGDADADDLVFLVENLVELQDGSGRVGTAMGDFNLDGLINATDTAIMKASFGISPKGWADGNANCDDIVNATDLAILGANYGFVAPAATGVPEPTTLALLALSGVAALHRRK